MKIDKIQQKELINEIKVLSGQSGYKTKNNTIYCKQDNAFIFCDYLVVSSQKLIYRINIKPYVYDDIFWNVMNMQANSKKNESLRAVGAFKAPSILIKKGEIVLSENSAEDAQLLVSIVNECSIEFVRKYDLDEYVVNLTGGMYIDILKYLAYINMGDEAEAYNIAHNAVNTGKTADFVNEGKSFFEWALIDK